MTAPMPYISLLLKLFAGAISLCLRQIRMKVRSFTINRSKALALGLYMKTSTNTVNAFGTFPSVRLIEGVRLSGYSEM